MVLCGVCVLAALKWRASAARRPENNLESQEAIHAQHKDKIPELHPADELFKASIEAYRAGDRDRALELADQAQRNCTDEPVIGRICNFRGVIRFEAGRHPEAVMEFLTAIRHDRENAGYYFNWAEALRAEGHPSAAVPPMNVAAKLRPEDLLTRLKLHFLLIESGQAESIVNDINRLSADGNLNLEAAFVKAALLRLNNQNEDCDELLAKLKKTAPPELYENCLKDRLFHTKAMRKPSEQ